MGLLNVALLIVVLLTTTSAKPMRHRHDADIPDKHQPQRYLAELSEGSEESSEESSEEEDGDEEVVVDVTEAVTVPPLLVVTTDPMTVTSGDGSTPAPEPDTVDTAGTVGPVIMVLDTTPEPAATAGALDTTTTVTVDVVTSDVTQTSIGDMRGDM